NRCSAAVDTSPRRGDSYPSGWPRLPHRVGPPNPRHAHTGWKAGEPAPSAVVRRTSPGCFSALFLVAGHAGSRPTAMPTRSNEFDFIVVGTGSAGAVLASRLSEAPSARVLALEAGGPDVPPNVEVPALWYTLLGSDVDWGYRSVPQPGLGGRQ